MNGCVVCEPHPTCIVSASGRWAQGLVVYREVGPGFSCVQGGGPRV